MGQKNSFFKKRTGEVIENTGSGPKNEPKRTGKRSGEVVENTYPLKKRTENEAETKLAMSLKIQGGEKNEVEANRKIRGARRTGSKFTNHPSGRELVAAFRYLSA
ncbi:MAG: hypothetical protein EPN47_07445 [Acidobacteria bacterium]|nr:MAG: hypothetical protein EPN47_07445 [Acidobacteriota bacterium]